MDFCSIELGATHPDPLLDWVYSPRSEGVCGPLPAPPSEHRAWWFRRIADNWVRFGIARNGTYALLDRAGQVAAAAVTGPPGTVGMSMPETGQNLEMTIEIRAINCRKRALGAWQHQVQVGWGERYFKGIFFLNFLCYRQKG